MKAGHFSAKIPGQLSAEINTMVQPVIVIFIFLACRPLWASGMPDFNKIFKSKKI